MHIAKPTELCPMPDTLCCSSFNSSERGAFDIRAGWAKSRRMVRLPGNTGAMQEVVQNEVFLSVSGKLRDKARHKNNNVTVTCIQHCQHCYNIAVLTPKPARCPSLSLSSRPCRPGPCVHGTWRAASGVGSLHAIPKRKWGRRRHTWRPGGPGCSVHQRQRVHQAVNICW